MDVYISKQDALDAFGLSEKTRKYGGDHSGYDTRMLYEIQDTIESLEPADVAPVRHGKWTKLFYDGFNCNKCGSTFVIMQGRNNMYYCPNCGAKMDKE